MCENINDLIECESASVRLSNGEIFEFPVVDNKDTFPNFFRTNANSRIEIRSADFDELIIAMYKRKENLAYLVCAWEKKEEINKEAMEEIISNPKLAYLLN